MINGSSLKLKRIELEARTRSQSVQPKLLLERQNVNPEKPKSSFLRN
jgi:hypothetical protein